MTDCPVCKDDPSKCKTRYCGSIYNAARTQVDKAEAEVMAKLAKINKQ